MCFDCVTKAGDCCNIDKFINTINNVAVVKACYYYLFIILKLILMCIHELLTFCCLVVIWTTDEPTVVRIINFD